MTDRSRWQQEYDALPEWARNLIDGLAQSAGFGGCDIDAVSHGMTKDAKEKYEAFHILLDKKKARVWWKGFFELRNLACAITAPFPAPVPKPRHEMTTENVVEIITSGEEDNAFDQPCYYGHRVNGHAVYCHNDVWPDSSHKCRRGGWGPNTEENKHENCPGFYPNDPKRIGTMI
jgi:hypothetical protein